MSTHTFRVAAEADAKNIATLVNSAYRGETSKIGWTTEADLLGGQRTDSETIERAIQMPDSFILCAFENEKMWGSVHLMIENDAGYLGMLTVDPKCQTRGYGKLLISEAENFLKKKFGVHRIWMTVITHRTELIAWYERRGYCRTGKYKPFPYGDEKFGVPKVPDLKMEILEKRF